MKERIELKFKGDINTTRNPIVIIKNKKNKFLFIFHLQQNGYKHKDKHNAFG